jgi:cardiolipin synthase
MKPRWQGGHQLRLLENGADYFPALLQALEQARREIWLESYIFANDEVGRRIAAALEWAADRGVCVRVLVDGFGGREFVARLLPRLRSRGVQVQVYRQELAPFRFSRHRLRRLHRKLVLIDGETAFIGGINIVSDFSEPEAQAPRHDYAVCVRGPVVPVLHASMKRVWMLVRWASLGHRLPVPSLTPPLPPARGGIRAALAIRDNLRHRRDIESAYLRAIGRARREILIANAYFFPGRRFRQALLAAAARGVRVTLLVQGQADHPLLQWATRALYGPFLAAGIRVFEYQRSHLHAKVAVVDGRWSTVGSSNIDPFSLLLAREANLLVLDRGFGGQLRARLERAIQDGAQAILPQPGGAGLPRRLLSWLAYGAVRLLIGLAGYGRQHEQGRRG